MNLNALSEKFGIKLKPGEIIFCEYEPGDKFYLIQTGKIKLTKVVKKKEKNMDFLGPGDVLGEMSILENAPRSATAVVVEEACLLVFTKANFTILLKSQPALAFKILSIFSKRIYDAKRRLMTLLLDDTISKIADTFLLLSLKDREQGMLSSIRLKYNIEDIADWCGEPLAKVQPIMDRWVTLGKLEIQDGEITLKDTRDFERIVHLKRKSNN